LEVKSFKSRIVKVSNQMQITAKNYQKLLQNIQQTIAKTKEEIVKTVDRQKVEMGWKIGKEIEVHLKGKSRASYGKELFERLAQDLQIDKVTLYQMHSFHKAYPKMPTAKKSLSWSHYRTLIAVKDEATRKQLENLVVEKSLGSDRLQKEIAATKNKKTTTKKSDEKIPQLKVKRGKLGTYTLTKEGEIDLGFNVFFRSNQKISTVTKSDYTYLATLERVVDGDTIHVKIDLGFGIMHREIIRLAKINAAESDTSEGKKATVALKKILNGVQFLILRTNKTDIYGRYVADVFFDEKKSATNPQKVADCGAYLNQVLLDRGLVKIFE